MLSTSRSSLHFESRLEARGKPVIAAMGAGCDISTFWISLDQRVHGTSGGHVMGTERAFRLWSKAGLQVPRKRPRKRVATSRPRPQLPMGANEQWAYDFVYDACANGQQIKCLTVVDKYSRECLAIDVAGSIRSGRVIEVLSRLISERGGPLCLRSDNGPEFVSKAQFKWAARESLDLALIEPGKPWQNGLNESFNGKLRDECLSMEWVRCRAEARVVIEEWRRH